MMMTMRTMTMTMMMVCVDDGGGAGRGGCRDEVAMEERRQAAQRKEDKLNALLAVRQYQWVLWPLGGPTEQRRITRYAGGTSPLRLRASPRGGDGGELPQTGAWDGFVS
jgi:hypothetical protein